MLSRRALPLVALALLLVACGGGQAKVARTAQYKTDANTVFKAVVDATGQKHKVERADAPSLMLVTVPRWYEADGTYAPMDASGEGAMLQDKAILLMYEVRVVQGAVDGTFQVNVIPHIRQKRSGYSALVDLAPDDMAVPGWVHGKTDLLYETIYASLKPYAVTAPGA